MKYIFTLIFFCYALSSQSQTGPGGVGVNDGTSALKYWVDASKSLFGSSPITGWTDLSGNGVANTILGNPSLTADAINGYDVISFDGSGDYISTGLDISGSTFPQLDIYAVYNFQGSSGAIWGEDNGSWDRFLVDANGAGGCSFGVGNGGGCTNSAALFPASTPVISSVQFWEDEPSGSSAIVNGSSVLTFTSNHEVETSNNLDLASIGNGGYPLTGDIAEVLVFGTNLNTAQQIIVYNYLSAKYNIVLTSNDVYTQDDSGDFDHDVAGIGIESDGSQTDSQGTGWVRINSASDMTTNGEYLMWGHDDATLSENNDVPTGYDNRTNREWRVSETGDIGTVTLTMDCSDFIIGEPDDLVLLIDGDGTFGTTDTEHIAGLSYDYATQTVTFTGVDFDNNDYFALGSTSDINALGGIYYSIATGDYDNTTNVWSLSRDGAACGCSPAAAALDDLGNAIITSHALGFNTTQGARNLKIESGGSLRYDGNVRFDIRRSLTVDDGGTIDGNGIDAGGFPMLAIKSNIDNNVYFGGTSGDQVTVNRILVEFGQTTTFQGTGNLAIGEQLRVSGNTTLINNMTGMITADELAIRGNESFLNNSEDGIISATDLLFIDASTNSVIANSGTINIANDLILDVDTDNPTITNHSTGTLVISNEIDPDGRVLIINNSGDFTHGGDFTNVDGDQIFSNLSGGTWTSSAADHDDVIMNCSSDDNTFVYNLAGVQDIFTPADGVYHNLTVQGSGTKTSPGNIDVNGDLAIGGGATLVVGTATSTLNVGGIWSNSGTFTLDQRNVIFDGMGDQSISDVADPATFYNLTFQGSGTKTLGGDLDVNNDLTIAGSATLEMAANSIELAGNWINTGGTFNEGTGTVTFDNTSAGQSITTSASDETFYDIDVSNSGQTITMNDDVNITNNLNFTTSGYIDVNTNNLTITDWVDGAVVGLGTNLDRFVIVDQIGSFGATGVGMGETVNLPIGLASGFANYARVDILNNDGEASFSANLCVGSDIKGGCSGSNPITTDIVNYTWNLTSTSTDATVTLYWDASKELSFDNTDVFIARFGSWPAGDGNHWDNLGGSGAATNLAGTVYSYSGTTNHFSPFGVGSAGSALPIELTAFNVATDGDRIHVLWTTATEIDNDYFTIERSLDGVTWTALTQVDGAGDSTEEIDYQVTDMNPQKGLSYYRLKQTDYDGTYTYSYVRSANLGLNIATVAIYPNPTKNLLTITGKPNDLQNLIIYDLSGNKVASYADELKVSSKRIIDLSKLDNGTYFLITKTTSIKFYKQ